MEFSLIEPPFFSPQSLCQVSRNLSVIRSSQRSTFSANPFSSFFVSLAARIGIGAAAIKVALRANLAASWRAQWVVCDTNFIDCFCLLECELNFVLYG